MYLFMFNFSNKHLDLVYYEGLFIYDFENVLSQVAFCGRHSWLCSMLMSELLNERVIIRIVIQY